MKSLMIWLLGFAILPSVTARAEVPAYSLADAIVKTVSYPCNDSSVQFRGSGLLFMHSGQFYVVTSEHVLLHGNQGICHTVANQWLPTTNAQLVAVDWGKGMALLQVGQFTYSHYLPELSAFSQTPVQDGDKLVIAGFPSKSVPSSTVAPVLDQGQVRVAEARVQTIPNIDSVIEIKGAEGEFGMSGGPVFSEDRSRIVGLLSHQYLELVPGGSTRVGEYIRDATTIQNLMLALPAHDVVDWVNSYFENPTGFVPGFVQDPILQQKFVPAVFTGGLKFELVQGGAGPASPVGGADGIGARHIAPGGADGIGARHISPIGGSDSSQTDTGIVRITVDPDNHNAAWPFPQWQSWFDKVKAKAQDVSTTVEVRFLLKRNTQSDFHMDQVTQVDFYTLSEFFKDLASGDLEPIEFINSSNLTTSADKQQILHETGQQIHESAGALLSISPSLEATKLLQRLKLIAQVLISSEPQALHPEDVNALVPPAPGCDAAWRDLFNNHVGDEDHFDEAVKLEQALVIVQRTLAN